MLRRHLCLGTLLAGLLSGCSLVTIEFPDEPLTEREMNARLATHRFVEHFSASVRAAADAAAAAGGEKVELEALRWKIGAMTAVRAAAFQASPRDALVDTWAYAAQMDGFFGAGGGADLFGESREEVIAVSRALREEIAALAKRFAPPGGAERYEQFVNAYAAEHPLPSLLAPRDSSVTTFHAFLGVDPEEATATVGTLPQVVHDFGSRVSFVAEDVGDQASWRTELFLRETGVDGASLQRELDRFGARLERVAVVAEQSPELLDDALLRLHDEIEILVAAVDEQRIATLQALSEERAALTAAVTSEREATIAELEQFADGVVADAWQQIRGIVDSVLLGAVALVVVVFGVPFGLGVLVGRVGRRARS